VARISTLVKTVRLDFVACLDELVGDLSTEARLDARLERAAGLAAELQTELRRLGLAAGASALAHRQAHAVQPRTIRTRRTQKRGAARLRAAFAAEREALAEAVRTFDEHGVHLSGQQLADLRLGERTRRVFYEAGLTYVQDLTSLSPDEALHIPHLAPASLAEVRAAVFFALEVAGGRVQASLPAPGRTSDLFEGLVRGVNLLPTTEREALVLRCGVEDRIHSAEEAAVILDCTAEFVLHLEERARNALLAQPAVLEACWRFEDLCARLGLGWDDERLPTVLATRYPTTRGSYTRLAAWLVSEKARLAAEEGGREFTPPRGIGHFEEMVVAALGRYGDLTGESLAQHVQAALTPDDRARYADVAVTERVSLLGPAIPNENGTYRLPDTPIPGVDDRHIRAVNALIGTLQRLGSARISALTSEVNRRLPRTYQVNEQYVRTWLTHHPELFAQSEQDRFRLATLDVEILCGLNISWQPEAASTVVTQRTVSARARMHERIGAEIEKFLRDQGPQPIARIRSHLYGRVIGQASADAIIANDREQRFTRLDNGLIALREPDGNSGPNDDRAIDLPTAAPDPVRRWYGR
jgi:hypothetical protein